MKTFSELFADYMARTGISDSELARTLGVRRQTIFRWKEGMVERPRHREDVLLCAFKLRLSPEERDELLLAAGFSPEKPAALSAIADGGNFLPTLAAISADTYKPPAPRRGFPLRALAMGAILALAIIVGSRRRSTR